MPSRACRGTAPPVRLENIIDGAGPIASGHIEDLLGGHPGAAFAAVVAAPDPVMGEHSCAQTEPRMSSAVAAAMRYLAQAPWPGGS